MRYLFFYVITLLIFLSCGTSTTQKEPLIKYPNRDGNGPQRIRDFSFINQDSQIVTNATFKDKIYVSNYFFTSCPTICPKITKQMLRIHDRFKDDDRFKMLSHSIDTKYDTVATLKKYADRLGVSSDKWNFITGDEKEIYDIAYDYFCTALKAPGEPGGYDHDDLIVLVDKNRNLRAFCHGLQPEKVDEFMENIEFLLESEY